MATENGTRSWAGVDIAQRQRIRRADLLQAGIELLGSAAGPAVSVRAVCKAAGMTERYFYASFADRDQFVLEVYEHVAGLARDALVEAIAQTPVKRELPKVAIEAFVGLIVDRPEMGRVLLVGPLTEPGLGGRGMQLAPGFGALIEAQLTGIADEDDRKMESIGLIGALTTLFTAYLDGTITPGRDRLVAHCVGMLERANRPVTAMSNAEMGLHR